MLVCLCCDVCAQLLKVDEDQQLSDVETSCKQIVDRLVQTALSATTGQSQLLTLAPLSKRILHCAAVVNVLCNVK